MSNVEYIMSEPEQQRDPSNIFPMAEVRASAPQLPEEEAEVRSLLEQIIDKVVDSSKLRKEMVEMRKSLNDMRVEVDTMRRTNYYYAEEIEELREKHKTLKSERAELQEKATTLGYERDDWRRIAETTEKERDELRAELDNVQHSLASKLEEVTGLSATVSDHANAVEQTREALRILAQDKGNLESDLAQLRQVHSEVVKARDDSAYRVMELEENARQHAEALAVVTERANTAEGRLSTIKAAFGW